MRKCLLLGVIAWLKGSGLAIGVVHLLVAFEVTSVQDDLLLMVQIVPEETLLIDAVDASLVELGVVSRLLLSHGR